MQIATAKPRDFVSVTTTALRCFNGDCTNLTLQEVRSMLSIKQSDNDRWHFQAERSNM